MEYSLLWSELSLLRKNGLLCDVFFKGRKSTNDLYWELPCHSLILAAASSRFQELHMEDNCRDVEHRVYWIQGLSHDEGEAFIDFIYSQCSLDVLKQHRRAVQLLHFFKLCLEDSVQRQVDEMCAEENILVEECMDSNYSLTWSLRDVKPVEVNVSSTEVCIVDGDSLECDGTIENLQPRVNVSYPLHSEKCTMWDTKNASLVPTQVEYINAISTDSKLKVNRSATGDRISATSHLGLLQLPAKSVNSSSDGVMSTNEETSTCETHESKQMFCCKSCGACHDSLTSYMQHFTLYNSLHTANYECCECSKQFKSALGFRTHYIKDHSEESAQFLCGYCDKLFYTVAKLNAHEQTTHSNERPFICTLCGRCFKSMNHLRRHGNTYHSSQRDHQCHLCGSTFKTKTDLKAHTERHQRANFKPKRSHVRSMASDTMACINCQRTFQTMIDRNNHQESCLGKSTNSSHQCAQCKKTFAFQSKLLAHLRSTHTRHKWRCDHCHKTFMSQKRWENHQQKCVNENGNDVTQTTPQTKSSHQCSTCGQLFTLKGNLKKHQIRCKPSKTTSNSRTSVLLATKPGVVNDPVLVTPGVGSVGAGDGGGVDYVSLSDVAPQDRVVMLPAVTTTSTQPEQTLLTLYAVSPS